MLKRCLSCHRAFEPNDALEYLPHGRRVAFDPARGRLWVICPACARWTLVPLESRWETLEQLERMCSGGARLLRQGENLGLYQGGTLEIVRVGRASLREEAWWRYGREFGARRRHARMLATGGKVIDALIMLAVVGIPFWGHSDTDRWIGRGRTRTFGPNLWRGRSTCPRCGGILEAIRFERCAHIYLEPRGDSLALRYTCQECGTRDERAGHLLTGVTAEHVLRRMLAYQNYAGGSQSGVDAALGVVERFGSPGRLLEATAQGLTGLGALTSMDSLAAEIALNDSLEAQLLAEEVAVLELRWREEERLADIIDGELTPVPEIGGDRSPR